MNTYLYFGRLVVRSFATESVDFYRDAILASDLVGLMIYGSGIFPW